MRLSNYLNRYLWTLYRLAERKTKFRLKAIFSCTSIHFNGYPTLWITLSLGKITKNHTCKIIPELILYSHSSVCHLKKKKNHSQSLMQGLYKWQHFLTSKTVEWMFATFDQAVKAATLTPIATSCSWDPICHKGVNASGTHFTWVINGNWETFAKARVTYIWLLEANNCLFPKTRKLLFFKCWPVIPILCIPRKFSLLSFESG